MTVICHTMNILTFMKAVIGEGLFAIRIIARKEYRLAACAGMEWSSSSESPAGAKEVCSFQEVLYQGYPFLYQSNIRSNFASPSVPIIGIAGVALLTVQVSMNPG